MTALHGFGDFDPGQPSQSQLHDLPVSLAQFRKERVDRVHAFPFDSPFFRRCDAIDLLDHPIERGIRWAPRRYASMTALRAMAKSQGRNGFDPSVGNAAYACMKMCEVASSVASWSSSLR